MKLLEAVDTRPRPPRPCWGYRGGVRAVGTATRARRQRQRKSGPDRESRHAGDPRGRSASEGPAARRNLFREELGPPTPAAAPRGNSPQRRVADHSPQRPSQDPRLAGPDPDQDPPKDKDEVDAVGFRTAMLQGVPGRLRNALPVNSCWADTLARSNVQNLGHVAKAVTGTTHSAGGSLCGLVWTWPRTRPLLRVSSLSALPLPGPRRRSQHSEPHLWRVRPLGPVRHDRAGQHNHAGTPGSEPSVRLVQEADLGQRTGESGLSLGHDCSRRQQLLIPRSRATAQ